MKFMNNVRKYGVVLAVAAPVLAHAEDADPAGQLLDQVATSLTTTTAKVIAIGVIAIGITIAFVAIHLGKRGAKAAG